MKLKDFCLRVSNDSGTVISKDDALKIGGFYCAMVLLHKQYLDFMRDNYPNKLALSPMGRR